MLFAPSGLVIYWLVSNVWSIGQQYFTIMVIGPPKLPGAATAAKPGKEARAVKAAPPDIVVPTRGKK
jgi:membrane protein insertase Oxa1/YidC/SpoIIIJ